MGIRPDRTPTRLEGKKIVITGASAGIGAAAVEAFAARGAHVVALARRQDRLDALADRVASAHGVEVARQVLDVRDRAAIEALAKQGTFKDTDILVNNAGLARGVDPLHEGDPDDWDQMVQTNLMGLLYLTRAVIPDMVARDDGHVVNIGSVSGRWTYPGGGVYCATKHAVRAISEGLRMDLMGRNIRVTNIEPGLVETEFSKVRLGSDAAADRVYADTVPLVAEDIADTIVWCCERPRHVNVQELVVYPVDQPHVTMVHRREAEA